MDHTDLRKLTAADVLQIGGKNTVHYTVPATATLRESLAKMKDQRIGALMVVEGDEVLGLTTERDIMWAISPDQDWAEIPISRIMTPLEKLITVSADDSTEECLEVMAFKKFRHLPVVSSDDSNSILGILSMKDVIFYWATDSISGTKSTFLSQILPHQIKGDLRAASSESVSLSLVSGAYSIPHPAKQETGGEDAHFIFNSDNVSAIGVADGVGSNSFEHGIDASLFPRGLMNAQQSYLEKASGTINAVKMLHHSWNHVVNEDIVGSSTICLLALQAGSPRLHAANLGDSGFLILRDVSKDRRNLGTMFRRSAGRQATIVYRSTQQLHDFNWPVQIGRSFQGDSSHFDTIQQAEVMDTHVQEGDVIVLASDGLFDNVAEEEILSLVDFDESDVTEIASKLSKRAFELSLDRMIDSPFAVLAKDHNIMWGGGRPDDITVIVSRVCAQH